MTSALVDAARSRRQQPVQESVPSRVVPQFPRLKCRQLIGLLKQLGYTLDRQQGSHRQFIADGRERITLSYADGDDVPPGVTRKNLVQLAGLEEDEAKRLVEGRWKPTS